MKNSIIIRPFENRDSKQLENICIATAPKEQCTNHKKREFVAMQFCRYYTQNCKNTVFVADNGKKAVGYILCDPCYKTYLKKFRKTTLVQMKKLYPFKAIGAYLGAVSQSVFSKKHNAHLHIDISPEYQRMGIGSLLMDALCNELRNRKINGVFLIVDAKNEKGVNFYKKYGFKTLFDGKSYLVMSLSLQ